MVQVLLDDPPFNLMVVYVRVTLVVEGVHRTTFGATTVLVLAELEPMNIVGVSRRAGAADEAFGIQGEDLDGIFQCTYATRVEGCLVKSIHTLHFSQELETFKAGSLLLVCSELTRLRTWAKDSWRRGVVRPHSRGSGESADGAELRRPRNAKGNWSDGSQGGVEHRAKLWRKRQKIGRAHV